MKYLIFGNGYLGNKFHGLLPDSVIDRADINDTAAVAEAIKKYQPQAVINCAAKTGKPNVDWCEDHKLETLDSNLRGALSLLKVCEELGQYWVQIGSGCIYEGDKNGQGWAESDAPNFDRSYYSKVKGWLNDILADFNVLQLRLRMPLDGEPGPRNFITKIATYPKVISVPNSITVIDDLVVAAKALMERKATGIYNVANPGVIEHKEILEMYKEIVDPTHTYTPISLEELATFTKAGRSNCVISSQKLEAAGIHLPEIHGRVRELLHIYKNNLDQAKKAL
ncbi:MAG: sugar nucleotide-binding protein [Parcubacteria group bacterium]|nr:sugar nucleotide-binding protein [Parcubacteria group bacterium]